MSSPEYSEKGNAPDHKCIFCSVVSGESQASIIERSARLHVIMSLEGTPLIFPNEHIKSPDEDPDIAKEVFAKAVDLVPLIKNVYHTLEYNIISNTGKSAGQEIEHFHAHIIPRTPGDRQLRFLVPQHKTREELDAIASKFNFNNQDFPQS